MNIEKETEPQMPSPMEIEDNKTKKQQEEIEEDEFIPSKKLAGVNLQIVQKLDELKKENKKNNLSKLDGKSVDSYKELNEYLEKLANWFKEEVEVYIEAHDGFMMGFHYEDLINNLVAYLEKIAFNNKHTKDSLDIPVTYKEETNDNKEDESTTTGKVYFLNREILQYLYIGDGYQMRIEQWDDKNLQQSIYDFLEKLAVLETSLKK